MNITTLQNVFMSFKAIVQTGLLVGRTAIVSFLTSNLTVEPNVVRIRLQNFLKAHSEFFENYFQTCHNMALCKSG